MALLRVEGVPVIEEGLHSIPGVVEAIRAQLRSAGHHGAATAFTAGLALALLARRGLAGRRAASTTLSALRRMELCSLGLWRRA